MTGLSVRAIPAAAAAIFVLALLWVYTSIDSIASSNIHSAAELVIPVWEPGDEEPAAKRSGDDETPTPTLLPTPPQSVLPETMEKPIDPFASELVEAAKKGHSVEESEKQEEADEGDDLLLGVFSNSANRPMDPVLPQVEPALSETPLSENTTTTSTQDLAQPSADVYIDETQLPEPPQTAPPNSPTDLETSLQLPPDLAADAGTDPEPQLPSPPDETTSSDLPPEDLSLLMDDTAAVE